MSVHRVQTARILAWLCALLVALPISLFTLSAAMVARAASDAGTCAVTPGSGQYPTINSATTDANCSTVTVPAGTFVEQVTIDHALSLTGAGQGATILRFPITTSTPQLDFTAIYIVRSMAQSGGVSIANLTIDGQKWSCWDTGNCGGSSQPAWLYFFGVDTGPGGVTANHVTFQNLGKPNVVVNGLNTGMTGVAIGSIWNSHNGQADTVRNSQLYSIVDTATRDSAPIDFFGNTLNGVGLRDMRTADGNLIENVRSIAPQPPVFALHNVATVTNNTFTNNDTAMLFGRVDQYGIPTLTVTNNTLTNNSTGIALLENFDHTVTVSGNHIQHTSKGAAGNQPGVAISVCSDNKDVIQNNVIDDSAYIGIEVRSATTNGCLWDHVNQVPGNLISGNTITHSGAFDIVDQGKGGGTAGTPNRYQGNTCAVSQPASLCASGASGGNGTNGAPTATPALTPQASVTVSDDAASTATVAASESHAQQGAPGNTMALILGVAGTLGLTALAGAFAVLRLRGVRRRLNSAAGPHPSQPYAGWSGPAKWPYDDEPR